MQAIEFDTSIDSGVICVPNRYRSRLSSSVRVILLPKEQISETLLASEQSLAKTWNTPEEDAAWATL